MKALGIALLSFIGLLLESLPWFWRSLVGDLFSSAGRLCPCGRRFNATPLSSSGFFTDRCLLATSGLDICEMFFFGCCCCCCSALDRLFLFWGDPFGWFEDDSLLRAAGGGMSESDESLSLITTFFLLGGGGGGDELLSSGGGKNWDLESDEFFGEAIGLRPICGEVFLRWIGTWWNELELYSVERVGACFLCECRPEFGVSLTFFGGSGCGDEYFSLLWDDSFCFLGASGGSEE